jgi:hypothetical protein
MELLQALAPESFGKIASKAHFVEKNKSSEISGKHFIYCHIGCTCGLKRQLSSREDRQRGVGGDGGRGYRN